MLHRRSHIKISFNAIMQVRQQDSLQYNPMLFLRCAALPLCLQERFITKTLTRMQEAARGHFVPHPLLSPDSNSVFPNPFPKDTSSLYSCFTHGPSSYSVSPKYRVHLEYSSHTVHAQIFPAVPKKSLSAFFIF